MSRSIHTTIKQFVKWRSKKEVGVADGTDPDLSNLIKKSRYKRAAVARRKKSNKG